jgi:hypothetical protein
MAADLNLLFISLAFHGDGDGLTNHLHMKFCILLDHIHIYKFCMKQLCNMPKITNVWSMQHSEVPTDKLHYTLTYIIKLHKCYFMLLDILTV